MMCATTPARELGLTGFGAIAEGAVADLVVLDRQFRSFTRSSRESTLWGQTPVTAP